MNKILSATFILGALLLTYALMNSSKKNVILVKSTSKLFDGGFFQFSSLPDGVLAQIDDMQIKNEESIQDLGLQALENEKNDLAIVQVYKELLLKGLVNPQVVYLTNTPNRSLESLFNQYALPLSAVESISFSEPKPGVFARVNGEDLLFTDIKKQSYRWGALETQIFYRSLKLIKAIVVKKKIMELAQFNKMSSQEFISQKILNNQEDVVGEAREGAIVRYLQENVKSLPVKVDLVEPQFSIELKPDWTPSIGPLESKRTVLVFNDFYSESSKKWMGQVEKLAQDYPGVYFGFRPVFPVQNQYQNMLAQIGFCIWALKPESYWKFMVKAMKADSQSFEKEAYKSIEAIGLELAPIKECFYKQEHKDVVKYHLEYAKFLDIQSGPIFFIDGKVFTSEISESGIKEILNETQGEKQP